MREVIDTFGVDTAAFIELIEKAGITCWDVHGRLYADHDQLLALCKRDA